jgi:hypothetical protein
MAESCPRCGARTPVRLGPEESCPACASTEAWDRYAKRGLTLDLRAIEESERRRGKEPGGGRGPSWRIRGHLPTAIAAALAIAALLPCIRLLRSWPLAPLDELRRGWTSGARHACLFGLAALGAAIAALLLLRRGRLFRSLPLVAGNLLAAGAGIAASVVGLVFWLGTASLSGWQFDRMTPLDVVQTPLARAAMEAAAVILAPDEGGDMRGLAIGSGTVIGRSAGRAWVLTNSHVAIPYMPAGAFRDASSAHPVWVYLSDGRNAEGRVRWAGEPPLDVALVSAEIEGAPEPVVVAPDAGGLEEGAAVFFVPNPFRGGWLLHRGNVLERDPHATPAGEFSLVFTDLPLQQGDSGSGLFDATGRLVGINTWQVLRLGGREAAVPRGISLPSNVLREIMDLIQGDALGSLESNR